MTDDSDPEEAKEETVLELVQRRYDEELERAAAIDGKAANLIGYVSVITGLIIGLGTLDLLDKTLTIGQSLAYYLGLAFLVGSSISALLATSVRTWKFSPEVDWALKWITRPDLSSDKGFDRRTVLIGAATSIGNSAKENFKQNQKKAFWLKVAWMLLVVGIVILIVFLAIYAAHI